MDFGLPVVSIGIVIVIIYLLSSIKILAEYERGVIFRLDASWVRRKVRE